MHIRKYDFDYARRSFLERTARGLGGAGVLAPLWPTLCQAGDAAPAYPEELLSIEAFTGGRVKVGDTIDKDNVELVQDLLDPIVYQEVIQDGRTFEIVAEEQAIETMYPPYFLDATLRNQGQAVFDDVGNVRTQDGQPWIGGLPFPAIENGNQAIANYLYGSSLLTVNTPFGTGYRLEKISNPDLKWEATKQYNAGLDLSLFDGRFDFTIDFYQKQTSDMLLQLSIPSYLGGTEWNDIRAPFANVGRMENKGFDLSLATRNVTGRKFSWTTNLTFSKNRNKILELDDDSRIYWRNLYWYSEFQTAT